jgi:CMP-N,N'-diacetyllegionaminic acid synthase
MKGTMPKPMIVGSICARGGSKGIPKKNLRKLAGKTLVEHAILCAQGCPSLDRIVVSTDDLEIADVARNCRAEVPFIRPAQLAQDNSSKWEVFRHLIETLESKPGPRIDILVDLDVCVPLRLPEDITGCIRQLLSDPVDVVVTAYESERNPYFNMVELDEHGLAKIVIPSEHPITSRQEAPKVYSLSPAVFAIRREALWLYSHWSRSRMEIFPIPRERAIDIDSDLDFRFVESTLNR